MPARSDSSRRLQKHRLMMKLLIASVDLGDQTVLGKRYRRAGVDALRGTIKPDLLCLISLVQKDGRLRSFRKELRRFKRCIRSSSVILALNKKRRKQRAELRAAKIATQVAEQAAAIAAQVAEQAAAIEHDYMINI